jgi:hypothetical protein
MLIGVNGTALESFHIFILTVAFRGASPYQALLHLCASVSPR